jgi:hypothetical protein
MHTPLDTVLAAFPLLLIRECRERSMRVCRVLSSDGFRRCQTGKRRHEMLLIVQFSRVTHSLVCV